ncbi:alpha/beta fold hydrolase [Arthrobacter sp. CJ23]|uniref:alpha/beta fold hydrolase n=1 Tax=Arthrobacter sp. CJ23 TaxID=2972479 RepID=UPI00215B96E5|nr:alpha/beta hydrolase [Arthrobacter sp. CJ23]UVJ39860.1 alpha/beta hydrolase [Arthrobacter sp. CJ23]
MSTTLKATRGVLAAAGRLSPRLAAELAFPLFMRVGRRVRVREEDLFTHDSARRRDITVDGKRVAVYEWGRGNKTVLLVHGWQGRASQFAALVRELRAEGLAVVAFDAPANGDSEGRGTYILDYIEAIRQLQPEEGFHAIVAHSFGVLAALSAVNEGVKAHRMVGIAGVADAGYLVDSFAAQLALRPGTTTALRQVFQRRVFPDGPDIFERFSGVGHPLPAGLPLLLVHDEADAVVSPGQSQRLAAAHPGRSQLLAATALGHTRILAADLTLEAVTRFVVEDEPEPRPLVAAQSPATSSTS